MSKRKTNDLTSNEDNERQKRLRIPATSDTTGTTAGATGLAFRISKIPSRITEDQFLQTLDNLAHDGGLVVGGRQNVLGWSFGPSAASADAERYRTATVTFKSVPVKFQLSGSSSPVDLIADAPHVIVDTSFYGLTPLNSSSSERPIIEYACFPGPTITRINC